jgi:hypothetical protein
MLLALALASALATQPIYLECQVTIPDGHGGRFLRHLQVNLNEAEETAGFTMVESGWTVQKRPAVFSPTKVSWVVPDTYWSTTYEIDRTTLAFSSRENIGGDAGWQGNCTIPEADPARKF